MKKTKKKAVKILIQVVVLLIIILSVVSFFDVRSKKNEISKYNVEYYHWAINKSRANAQEVDVNTKDMNYKNLKFNDEGVPVLMYHSVINSKDKLFAESKENFKRDMMELVNNGYSTITLDELYNFLLNNKPIPKKSVVITFDDGYKDNYTIAYPILKELNLKATIFVITKNVDKNSFYLTTEQMKEMMKNGIDIQSHTVAHEKLTKLSYDEQLKTLKQSKIFLEEKLNKKVQYIAYPYGKYNIDTLKAAKEAGYEMAFTTVSNWSNKSDGILSLDRVFVSGRGSKTTFDYRISNPKYLFRYWPF